MHFSDALVIAILFEGSQTFISTQSMYEMKSK